MRVKIKLFQSVDKPLLILAGILFLGGLLILSSASMVISARNSGTVWYYIARQGLMGGGVGLIGFFIALAIPYRIWRKLSLPLLLSSLVFLALLFLPGLGFKAGGAKRWLVLGPVNFQPSELLKFSFIVYLASWLDARRHELGSISYGMIPFAIMLSIIGMFLVMQPDIGTLGVIVFTAGILYFLGGGKVSQIATLGAFGGALIYFLAQTMPYMLSRFRVFFNSDIDPQGIGYQTTQSFIAIGSGGFWGRGFGRSLQKLQFLPEPMGDSIFAVFAEEMGLVGTLSLILLFVLLFWRGLYVAKRAPDTFGKLLAAGISISIMLQAFINMAAISGLMPLTGIPLPFVSYGGTSLAVTLVSVGVLLNISKNI